MAFITSCLRFRKQDDNNCRQIGNNNIIMSSNLDSCYGAFLSSEMRYVMSNLDMI
jgi:hypothetical protein